MERSAGEGDLTGFRQAAVLAAALAHPSRTLDPAGCRIGALSPRETASLARHPAIRRGIDRALCEEHGITALPLTRGDLAALQETPDGRLALLLLTEPVEQLSVAALPLAAAALHRHVLQLTHKADRHRIRDILGPDAYLVATGEAPTQHPGLALAGARPVLDEVMADALAPGDARQTLAAFGLCLLSRVVDCRVPALAGFMPGRLPPAARRAELRTAAAELGESQVGRVTRFVRRRMPAWSAIIA